MRFKPLIVVVAIVIALGAGLLIAEKQGRISFGEPEESSTGKADIGGKFTLTDQDGDKVSDSEFRGKYMLVFFGFTSCPSICPVGMATLTQTMEQLEKDGDADKMQPIFITVDPETDTPKRMKEYLANFYPSIIGLTGSQAELDAVQKEYKVYASKVKDKTMPSGYNVDHTGFIYLMDKNGEYLRHCAYNESPRKLASDIEEALH